jgi:hypothetical protein
MLTLIDLIRQMYARQRLIAVRLGSDIDRSPKTMRVMNLSLLALIAVILRVLIAKNVVTVPELLAELNSARDSLWDDEPTEPPPLNGLPS